MKYNPLGKRVILRELEKSKVTQGGIILTAGDKEAPTQGEVVAVGPDVSELNVGDIVIASWGKGTKFGSEGLYVIDVDWIVAVIE